MVYHLHVYNSRSNIDNLSIGIGMKNLNELLTKLTSVGFSIVPLGNEVYTANRKKGMAGGFMLFGILGLLFWIIPGILILLVGYAAREDEILLINPDTIDELYSIWCTVQKSKYHGRNW